MATLKLVLDQRRKRKDGLYPLIIRLSHQSSTRDLPTQVKLKPSQFNSRKGIIKGNQKLNDEMQRLLLSYTEIVRKVLTQNPLVGIQELKEQVLYPKIQQTTIREYWEAEIERLNKVNRASGARVYTYTLSALSKVANLDVPFASFTYQNLKEMDTALYTKGMKVNGVGAYMRTFRAVCNKAIKDDLVGYDWYPFRKYSIRKERTLSRALSLEELQQFFNLDIAENHPAYDSWCIGKLIFMLRGINIKDLLLLTEQNITGDRIQYRRSKTGTLYSIQLLDEAKLLLCRNQGDTLLGRITKEELDNAQALVTRCMQNRKTINKHLKNIGKQLQLSQPLTTYCFRHSWASLCRKSGYPKDLIAQGLGHASTSVTDTYLEQFDQGLVDEMNKQVVESVCKAGGV